MVKNKRALVIAVGCLLLVAAYFLWGTDSPEKQVRNRLDALCDCIDKAAGEPNTTLILKNERLGRLLADQVDVSGDASILRGTHDSTEFLRLVQQGRFMFQSVNLSFADVAITIVGEDKATVECTASLSVDGKGGQTQSQHMVRQLSITLVKVENAWVFKEFNLVQVLEK